MSKLKQTWKEDPDFKKLREEFIQSFSERLKKLKELLQQINQTPASRPGREKVGRGLNPALGPQGSHPALKDGVSLLLDEQNCAAHGSKFLENRTELVLLVHKLAGAAASYHFPVLGDLSEKLDQYFSEGNPPIESMIHFSKLLEDALVLALSEGTDPTQILKDSRFSELTSAVEQLLDESKSESS